MYEHLLHNLLRSMEAVKRHIAFSSIVRELIGTKSLACTNAARSCFNIGSLYEKYPDLTDWKIIDHCSSVTQIYASFERFVHELLAAYLGFIESNFSYKDLEKKFRDEHRRRLGHILVDLDKERYKGLSLESIISDLANAIEGKPTYRLLPEAMLIHDQNLRMSELTMIFDRCGVANVSAWVSKHRAIKRFFLDQSRQSDTAEAELKQLVQYRNDSAHGGTDVDSVVGPDVLIEYADFISALSMCLVECVQNSCLIKYESLGKAHLSGSITEKYSDNRVVAIVGKQKFSVGDSIYLSGELYCFRAMITSIMSDNAKIETITILEDKELGFGFDVEPQKRAKMYKIDL